MTEATSLGTILAVALTGYWLGTLPAAYVAARLNGVDIFSVGTGQAGATNVWRQISRRVGTIVFFFDFGKGALAVLVAILFGLSGAWIMLGAAAAVLGHWNSPFTRFRGGDGVSILAGIVFGVAPLASAAAFGPAVIFRALGSFNHPTLWGGLAGAVVFLLLAFLPGWGVGPEEFLATAAVASAVLLHSLVHHRRRRPSVLLDSNSDATLERAEESV